MTMGIDLMLMSIYIIGNTTSSNRNDFVLIEPKRYNWELDLGETRISLSDQKAPLKAINLPKKLTITTLEAPPYSGTVKVNNTIKGSITTHAFYIFDLMSSNLNFTYEIIMPDTPKFGNKTTGLVAMLNQSKVDMAVAYLPILLEVNEQMSYSTLLTEIEVKAIMKRPTKSAVGSGLLAPFDGAVWICILISLAMIGPAIFIFTRFKSFLWGGSDIDTYSFTQCVWFTYGAILKQGSIITPKTNSIRLLFASWWIFITILTSFYTANLTAFLTLSEFTLPYKELEDIVKSNKKWTSIKEHYIDYALRGTTVESLRGLKRSYSLGNGRLIDPIPDLEILKKLQTVAFFFGEKNHVEGMIVNNYLQKTKSNIVEKEKCAYVIMPKFILRQPVAFAFQKNSPIQDIFDKKLRNLMESGIFMHLRKMELPSVTYCPLDLKNIERQLKNTDLHLTYNIVIGGFSIAMVVFMFEMIRRHSKEDPGSSCLCCSPSCGSCKKRRVSEVQHQMRHSIRIGFPQDIDYFNSYPNVGKPSPIYENIYNKTNAKKLYINGRDYWVFTQPHGDKRLVPIRTPSALLFQYPRGNL